jgi:tRNA G18 (ribose-2'-O)-methylase SpoU
MRKLRYEEIQQARLTEQQASVSERRLPVIAILEDIRSLYNVGSIFRTSDGAHIEAIYTVGYTPHPPRKEIEKTALGATKTVPHQHFETIQQAFSSVKKKEYKIAALEIAEHSRRDFPLAIIVGNEITGVSPEAMALCDFALEIPMLGTKHSLNVAVAYGIGVFACVQALQA